MSDLKLMIQSKKESKDYYTIREGLITEQQCFEAIEATGHRLYVLKDEINKKIKSGSDPQNDVQLQAMVLAAQSVHNIQATIVNDVCSRFEVIHPEYMNTTEELLKYKQKYWDWYKDQYKKYYGRSAPEILE